jgi:hypothetical protein
MVLFRRHREFLDEAMKTVTEVNSIKDIEDITGYTNITVEKYGGFDKRIGWDTYIVCENGRGCGFTNGPLE